MRWPTEHNMFPIQNPKSKIQNCWFVLGLTLVGLAPWTVAAEPRDPFMFGPREGEAATGRGQLTGILWDATTPLAVIDGEPLGVGSVVAGWTVTAIASDHVVIERDSRRETLVPGTSISSE